MKVKILNKCGKSAIVNMDKSLQLYPHFKLQELANNLGDPKQPQMILSPEQDELLWMIEQLRSWWNKPMTCSSCYRQPDFNKSVGGDANSLHLQALAFDWKVNVTDRQRTDIVNYWKNLCDIRHHVGGINLYTWGFHLDASEDKFGYTAFKIRDKMK